MKDKLIKLKDNAIVPQNFTKSSAIALMKDGNSFSAVCIKNNIYRDSITAEAAVISKAIVNSYNKADFEKIYIYYDSEDFSDAKYFNREIIHEFLSEDSLVYLLNKNTEKIIAVKDIYKEFL